MDARFRCSAALRLDGYICFWAGWELKYLTEVIGFSELEAISYINSLPWADFNWD